MDAPDAHWLLVKQDWLPIEALLEQLVPLAENTHDRVESLQGRLDAQSIRDLHTLRLQRNRVLHKNQSLGNPLQWRDTALRVRRQLEALHRARTVVDRFRTPGRASTLSRTTLPAQPAGLRPQGRLANPGVAVAPVSPPTTSPAQSPGEATRIRPVWWRLLDKWVNVVLWCTASWWLQPLLQSGIDQVAPWSVAWWLLGLGWLLCWPGIAMAYLAMGTGHVMWGAGVALSDALVWLVRYVIAHPY